MGKRDDQTDVARKWAEALDKDVRDDPEGEPFQSAKINLREALSAYADVMEVSREREAVQAREAKAAEKAAADEAKAEAKK